jgi:hypothetical protein
MLWGGPKHSKFLLIFQKFTLDSPAGSEMVKKFLFLLLAFSFFCNIGEAQILENYQDQIRAERYTTWFKKHDAAVVRLDLITFPNSQFEFKIPSKATVFIGNKLWFNTVGDSVVQVHLQDFKQKFHLADSTKVTLTIIRESLNLADFNVGKGYFGEEEQLFDETYLSKENQNPIRKKSVFYDFFYLTIIIVFLLIGLYKMVFPLELEAILQPLSVFSAEDFSDSPSIQKFFTVEVLFYLIVVSMMISSLVMVLIKEGQYPNLANLVNEDVNRLFLHWLIGTIVLTGLTVLKFIFLRTLIFIFDLGRLEFPHFFYLLRIVSIIVIAVALAVTFTNLNFPDKLQVVIQYSVLGFFWAYVFGILLLFVIMMNRMPFKNYHLFAYICIAELMPFLIISKLIMG